MKFLFNIFLSLCLLSFTVSCSHRNQMKVNKKDRRFVIIGAGMAGLSAASYLRKKGYSPIVLEAQDRIGGRVRTQIDSGTLFDEGASWIHGPSNNPITRIAKKAGAETYLTDDESIKVFDKNGNPYKDDELTEAEELYNDIIENLDGIAEENFAEVFYSKHPEFRDDNLWTYMLSAFLEFDTGGDIYDLSSTDYYDDEAFKGDDVIITNGYDLIPKYLAQNVDIRLNTFVNGINYEKDNIYISTNNGEYVADKVLITVPLGVLKKNIIQFQPNLPERITTGIHSLKMGSVNKFLLIWDDAFWPEDIQYFGFTPETKGKFNYFLNVKKYSDKNALMTFAFGEFSKQTENETDDKIIQDIMGHLRIMFGDSISAPTQFHRTRWSLNPNSFGAYSHPTPNLGSAAFEVFQEPIDGKIYFAGEHTIIDYRGTIHGAYLSGRRAAKRMRRK